MLSVLDNVKWLADVSVVVYLYNKSSYIEYCMENILNGAFIPSEIIIIDDFSEDDSYEICMKISQRVMEMNLGINLKILKNSYHLGKSLTYNAGIILSNQSYILFIDSDEFLQNEILEYLFRMSRLTNADILGTKIDEDKISKDLCGPIFLPKSMNVRLIDFNDNETYWSICGKIFKREFLLEYHIIFEPFEEEKHILEDTLFMFKCLSFAETYIIIPHNFYSDTNN